MGYSRGGSGGESMGGSGVNLCGGVMGRKQVGYFPGVSCGRSSSTPRIGLKRAEKAAVDKNALPRGMPF